MNDQQMCNQETNSTSDDHTQLNDENSQTFENRQKFQSNCKFVGLFTKCILLIIIFTAIAYAFVKIFEPKFVSPRYNQLLSSCQTIHQDTSYVLTALAQQQRGLIEFRLENGTLDVRRSWAQIPLQFNQIWKKQFQKMEVLKLLSDGEEIKYFLPFCPDVNQLERKCTIVTFGVGRTVNAEQKLISIYPQCHLVAADPTDAINANLTNEIGGTFVQTPVGGETANELVYSWEAGIKMVPQIGIVDFMNNNTNWHQEPVDLLLIDIEGAEFGVIEQLAFHYERFSGLICQFNIEVHDPNLLYANYTHQQFFRSLDTLLRSGHFALMNTDMYTAAAPLALYLRMFFVNVVDEKCTKKFFC